METHIYILLAFINKCQFVTKYPRLSQNAHFFIKAKSGWWLGSIFGQYWLNLEFRSLSIGQGLQFVEIRELMRQMFKMLAFFYSTSELDSPDHNVNTLCPSSTPHKGCQITISRHQMPR